MHLGSIVNVPDAELELNQDARDSFFSKNRLHIKKSKQSIELGNSYHLQLVKCNDIGGGQYNTPEIDESLIQPMDVYKEGEKSAA